MQGSGYRTPPALARRADGQTVQLTPLLYATLAALDGQPDATPRSPRRWPQATRQAGLGGQRRASSSRSSARWACSLEADGTEPELKRSNPLLGLRFKVAVTDEEKTRRLTAPFAALFNPVVVVAVCWRLRLDQLVGAVRQGPRVGDPRGVRPARAAAAVLAMTVLSAGFHEFGHAAAARRGGATPGRDGRRALPRLAGVLHRRHRLLPARPRRPAAHRPRRPLLQRDRRRRHRRRLVGHPLRRDPAAGRHPDPADAAPAPAVRPLRRLPRARRPDRRPDLFQRIGPDAAQPRAVAPAHPEARRSSRGPARS